jgi:hypothetical protein
VLQWSWNLIWEWRLTLPSFGLANRQKHVYFPNCIHQVRTPCGLATGFHVSNNCKSCCRPILAPCAIAWSAVRQSVPDFATSSVSMFSEQAPSTRGSAECQGISWESSPENTDTTELHRRLRPEQQKRERLKRITLCHNCNPGCLCCVEDLMNIASVRIANNLMLTSLTFENANG